MFYEFVNMGEIPHNQRLSKAEYHKKFIDDYPDFNTNRFKLSVKKFSQWLNHYAEFKKLELLTGNSHNVGRWFEIVDPNQETEETPF